MNTTQPLSTVGAPSDAESALRDIAADSAMLVGLLNGLDTALIPIAVMDAMEDLRAGLGSLDPSAGPVEVVEPCREWVNIWAVSQGAGILAEQLNEALNSNGVDVDAMLQEVPGSAPAFNVLDLLSDDVRDSPAAGSPGGGQESAWPALANGIHGPLPAPRRRVRRGEACRLIHRTGGAHVCTLKNHRQYLEDLALSLGVLCPADAPVFPCVIRRARGRQANQTVVRDVDFTRPWNPDAITKEFGRGAKAAGLNGVHFHTLRHTHATQLLQGGVQPHTVAQRLGHSTPVITMTIYAHVLKRADDQASLVAGAMLSAALGASY